MYIGPSASELLNFQKNTKYSINKKKVFDQKAEEYKKIITSSKKEYRIKLKLNN